MADEADDAARMTELHNDLRIQAARRAAGVRELQPRGSCYNCNEEFTGTDKNERLYCDQYCKEDHEKRLRVLARSTSA